MQLFFLGGVHGSGKSTLCIKLASRTGALFLRASQLIRETGVEPSTEDKLVADIAGNQDRLVRALERHRSVQGVVVLDGHFCVRAIDGAPAPIPLVVFERIGPTALMLLVDSPARIADRLRARDHRDVDESTLSRLCECENLAAEHVRRHLNVPLKILEEATAFVDAIAFIDGFAHLRGAQ